MKNAATRDVSILIVSAMCLALIIFAHLGGALRMPDALFFDAVNLRDTARAPKVIIVRSDPAFNTMGAGRYDQLIAMAKSRNVKRIAFAFDPELAQKDTKNLEDIIIAVPPQRVPGGKAWRLNKPERVAAIIAAPEYGIYRRQLAWINGDKGRIPVFETAAAGRAVGTIRGHSYLVRLPQSQNIPQIDASQLIGGVIERDTLSGLVVVVEGASQTRIATASGSGADAMSSTQYSAAAIQTLIDRREVTILPAIWAAFLLTLTAILLTLIYVRYDAKRMFIPAIVGGFIVTLGSFAFAIIFANIVLPITALLSLQLVISPAILYQSAQAEERRLKRFVTRSINQSVRPNAMNDVSQIPAYLTKMASALGIGNMAIVDRMGDVITALNAKNNEACAAPDIDKKIFRRMLAQMEPVATKTGGETMDGNAIIAEWPGDIRISQIGAASSALYWIYTLPSEPMAKDVAMTASKAAESYLRMQSLQDDLRDGPDNSRRYFPMDEWAANAVQLVTEQSGQVTAGIDRLDTAVILFHPFGFPIHANAKMAEVYALAGLSLAETSLADAIAKLTDLETNRIDLILRDLLINGGEMRVHCRDLDTRMRNLRIAALAQDADDPHGTIILEAVDITDLKYLAELNLSVGTLLNLHLRNDLEAVSLASTMAQDARLPEAQRMRVIGQVEKATSRARSRLEDVALRFRDVRNFNMTEAYPVELVKVVNDVAAKTAKHFTDLGVGLAAEMPSVGGYVIAEPLALSSLIEAILHIVSADSLPGENVRLHIQEEQTKSTITISGGIGMAFDQIYRAIDNEALDAPTPFKSFGAGLSYAVKWGSLVTYSSGVGKGYRFNIEMRRVG